MPPLLQSAQLKPDVTITSADSDNEIEDSDDERSAFPLLPFPFPSMEVWFVRHYHALSNSLDLHISIVSSPSLI